MRESRARFRGLAWAAGAALVIGLVYAALAPRPVIVETQPVRRGLLVETIRTDGMLRARDRVIVPAPADGDIRRVDLRVGDEVRRGQRITELFWDLRWDPVRAPIRGVVSRVFRESAGPIRRGAPIIEVIDPRSLEVITDLLTTDATRVPVGAPATIEGWGGEGSFLARVVRVSKAGFTEISALGVEEERTEVTLDPDPLPRDLAERVGSTFHVEIAIRISETPDALKVPAGALFRNGAGWAAYRVIDGRARLTPIEIGTRGEHETQVRSGVEPGEKVIVHPGDRVSDGVAVREG